MKKEILMTPGPSQVPPAVAEIAGRPIIHHRTPEFREVLERVHKNIKIVIGTAGDVFLLASSGTGALEASIVNVLSAGDKAIVVDAGKFGERYAEICKAYGVEPIVIKKEWGQTASAADIADALKKNPDAKAVCVTHSETSTGVLHDLEAIGKVVATTNALFIVDTVSALGGVPMKFDEWKIDMLAAGSQKALMLPPGLAFITVSQKAWKANETSKLPKFYFNIKKYKKTFDSSGETPFTPAVTLCRQLDVALKMILDEGLDKVMARHKLMSRACKAGVKAMGLKLLSENSSDVETVIMLPESIDGAKLNKSVETRFGIKFAGGQEKLKGKIVRIAHMGYVSEHDVLLSLSALEMCLEKMGFGKAGGAAVSAAQEVFQSEA